MIEFSVDLRVNFKSTDLLYPAADGGQDLMVESLYNRYVHIMQFMVPYVHVSGIWPPTMVTPTVCPDVHPPPA